MAMMPCKECNHQISDRAASCPNCGAPVATPVVVPPPLLFKRVFAAVLLLAGVGAVIWVVLPHPAREQVTGMVLGVTHKGASATAHEGVAPTPVAVKAADVPLPLYSTTAEQLYQDYSANVVAAQSRIGSRRIRISGNVTEIDEDDAGRPLVKLWSGNPPAGSAAFRLNDDQKAAAAELVKGQAVDLECARMQHAASGPEGTGCALVPVDPGAQQAYLAVAVSDDKGQAPIYIVGPMPRSTCLTRSDIVSTQVAGNMHIVSKQCSATAQENLPSVGCRLDSSMSAVPDMPAAHLWKYECAMPDIAARPAKASTKESRASRKVAVPTPRPTAESDSSGELADALPPMFTPMAVAHAASVAPAAATAELAAAASTAATAPAPDSSAGMSIQAASPAPDAGPATPIVAGTASTVSSAASTPAPNAAGDAAAPTTPSELMSVKAKDPGAADHIASYCNNATAAAANHDAVAAGCRRDEVAAWNRMVVQNEFPSLDDASRQKCSQAPFPDSYVAKEVCAKYQLRVN
jgi:hypothetical protein